MIIVTGAAGFIGSNIVADLETAHRGPIAVIDWLRKEDKWRNLSKRTIATFVLPEQVDAFLAKDANEITAIIHMGAISATTETDVDKLVRQNIQDSVRYWDWCAEHRIPFIYASSAATYGSGEFGYIDNESPKFLASLRPLNAYGWSKKAVDEIFVARIAAGMPAPPQWVGLKFFNVYGPNEYHKHGQKSVVATIFDTIRSGARPRLFKSYREGIADGDQRRDFVYVKDCTRAILWLLDHPEVSGIYNIGSGTARSFLDIATAMSKVFNMNLDVEFIEMPDAIREKYQYFTQAEMTKLRSRGYDTPSTSLEDGVADYINAYLSHEDRHR